MDNPITILDDAAIAEIEARPCVLNSNLIRLSATERDALCATVRVLRSEVDRGALCEECDEREYNEDGSCRTFTVCGVCWNVLRVQIARLQAENEKLSASRRVHELDNHHNALACGYCAGPLKNELTRLLSIEPETATLREQLEQVTKELAEEKRLRSELKEIAQTGIAEVSSVGAVLKDNAITDFRARAIALCRDKAAEYEQSAEEFKHDDRLRLCLSSKREAYKAMADELEQLK